jgi:hypothetical protein
LDPLASYFFWEHRAGQLLFIPDFLKAGQQLEVFLLDSRQVRPFGPLLSSSKRDLFLRVIFLPDFVCLTMTEAASSSSRIYAINLRTEQIWSRSGEINDSGSRSTHANQLDYSSFLESFQGKTNKSFQGKNSLQVWKMGCLALNDIYLSFLLQLNEDFDDDLLQ